MYYVSSKKYLVAIGTVLIGQCSKQNVHLHTMYHNLQKTSPPSKTSQLPFFESSLLQRVLFSLKYADKQLC